MNSDTTILEWEKHFRSVIRREKYIKGYLSYVEDLFNKNIPIIFELRHLSELVGINLSVLAMMVNSSRKFYREFSIPKRKGGQRVISTPFPALLNIQRWIYQNILKNVPMLDCNHGFVESRSIITNAQQHLGQKCLLKMDIAEFFPSIKINRIIEVFKRFGYPLNVSYYLASLCCLNNSLPQGAATSPMLSNIVFKRIDRRLSALVSSCCGKQSQQKKPEPL